MRAEVVSAHVPLMELALLPRYTPFPEGLRYLRPGADPVCFGPRQVLTCRAVSGNPSRGTGVCCVFICVTKCRGLNFEALPRHRRYLLESPVHMGLELRLPLDGFDHDMFKSLHHHTKGGQPRDLELLPALCPRPPTTTANMGQFAEQLNSVAHLVARAAAEQVRASIRRPGAGAMWSSSGAS